MSKLLASIPICIRNPVFFIFFLGRGKGAGFLSVRCYSWMTGTCSSVQDNRNNGTPCADLIWYLKPRVSLQKRLPMPCSSDQDHSTGTVSYEKVDC